MKTVNQIVGENMKKIRELSGFTQEQVAKLIGIERSAYSNYEGGVREAPYNILESISNLFGCEPFILFEDNIHENDLQDIANFKDIVKSYLRMERISQNETK